MEVFNKLRNTVSNTLSNTVSSTAHSLSQLSGVLPGNPVTREYEITSHICSAGPGLLWKVYSGFKKSTKQKAAIFVFEKRLLDQYQDKLIKDNILEILKKGVIQLTKLRHPQILTVQHPLEESRDSLAFATEPVFASLANILGNTYNLPQNVSSNLRDFKLLDLETKFGLFQLGECLAFLHNDVKMLHRNLCPESIVVNDHGDWKIFGFDFCAINQTPEDKPSWNCIDYDSLPPSLRISIHYQAPECIKINNIGPPSDIFSLGVLICYLHNSQNPLWNSRKDTTNYQSYLDDLKNLVLSSKNFVLPETLKDTVKLMFHNDTELRPDAYQFVKIEYFNDIGVKTLIYLDKLFQWDNLQKSKFYKGLPQILQQFPRRIVLQKVLPALQKEFVNTPMIPFLLPSILQVMEDCNTEEFNENILPMLKQIFVINEPPQISLLLLQKIELLLKWCSADIVKNFIVPMMTRALDSKFEQLQQHCLIAIPSIVTIIGGPCLKNSLIPRIKKICLSGKTGTYSLSVRVNCLLCLSKIIEQVDAWVVRDEILPFLQQIPCNGEPPILMPIIGLYKLILSNSKLGISKDVLATKILPFLLPLCIDQSLSPSQYELLVSLVNDMISQVINEHRDALQQLQKTRQFQENMTESLNISSPITSDLKDISIDSHPTINRNQSNHKIPQQSLSLDDKHRLAKQAEMNLTLNKDPLIPTITSPSSSKSNPKNLTDTLLANNLNQLNWSSNKTSQTNYGNQSTGNFVNLNTRNQMQPTTLNWNQSATNNFQSNTSPMQLNKSNISPMQLNKTNTSPMQLNKSNINPMQLNKSNTSPMQLNKSNTSPMQLSKSNFGWTSPPGYSNLSTNSLLGDSNSQQQNTPTKLSTEEIIDFLK